MTEANAIAVAGKYEQAAIYYADSDCVEYVKFDGYCLYERVDPYLTLIKDTTGHNLVGFKLKGFRNIFERLKPALELSDRHFLPMMSAIEQIWTFIGNELLEDEERAAAYRAAYLLAVNDNVHLSEDELLAA